MNKPIVAISIGDPAGIGPEITLKALSQPRVYEVCRPLVVGERRVLEKIRDLCGLGIALNAVTDASEGRYAAGTVDYVDLANLPEHLPDFGAVDADCGRASYEYVESAVRLALAGKVDAVATAPINKESLAAGKVPYIGHTEILGGLAGVADPLTMFEVRNMRIFFLSRHVSLRKACDLVTKDRLLDYIERCTASLKQLGIPDGLMAIAGLNPHSGEHGLFGDEEVKHVEPAVEEAKRRGYKVTGPVGADSVFAQCLQGKFSAVLSLYHDQGHIAAKTLDFERTISITLGLPFLRTSVDHGTAFDIAGKNVAGSVSMTESILLAAKYAPHFTRESHAAL